LQCSGTISNALIAFFKQAKRFRKPSMTTTSPHYAVRVVIVEDDKLTRENLCSVVASSPDYVLAASFCELSPALAWIADNSVDLLLTDIGLPDGTGIDMIRACAARWPTCDIMVITMFGDERNVLSSIEAGATGYMLKDGGAFDLGRAMQDLRNGGSPMSPLIARKVLAHAVGRIPAAPSEPERATSTSTAIGLSKRESETLDLIARGYTYGEAARLMGVSLSTVQTHIRSIYRKLMVTSRGEAVFEAHKLGLLAPGLLQP
jgi:DNA-binding NarL/FixJ family response regulator